MDDMIRSEKQAIKHRVAQILQDYLMDEGETYAYISLYFEKGEETQTKRLVFGTPSAETPDLYRDQPEGYHDSAFVNMREILIPVVTWQHVDGTPWNGKPRAEIFGETEAKP